MFRVMPLINSPLSYLDMSSFSVRFIDQHRILINEESFIDGSMISFVLLDIDCEKWECKRLDQNMIVDDSMESIGINNIVFDELTKKQFAVIGMRDMEGGSNGSNYFNSVIFGSFDGDIISKNSFIQIDMKEGICYRLLNEGILGGLSYATKHELLVGFTYWELDLNTNATREIANKVDFKVNSKLNLKYYVGFKRKQHASITIMFLGRTLCMLFYCIYTLVFVVCLLL